MSTESGSRCVVNIAFAFEGVNGVLTTRMGAHPMAIVGRAGFEDVLTTAPIEACVDRIETGAKSRPAELASPSVKPQPAALEDTHRDSSREVGV